MKLGSWILRRFVPSLLLGASAVLLAVGMLSYASSAFGQWQTPEPTTAGDPLFETTGPDGGVAWASGAPGGSGDLPIGTPSPAPSPLPSDAPSDSPTDQPAQTALPTDPITGATQAPRTPGPGSTPTPITNRPTPTPGPGATPRPTPTPRPPQPPTGTPVPSGNAVATRVVIPSLDIDLPVVASDLKVKGNVGNYPLCDVAMQMVGFVNPGQPGTTYIYGHAQDGMFAPLLHTSRYNNGASMIGALVQVYTKDSKLHLYEIKLVKRHATDFSITNVPKGVHQLVLQTSEGYHGHVPKLQIAAKPLTVLPASYRDSHPTPQPRVCLPS